MNLFKIYFILINFKLNYEIVYGFCSSSLAKTFEYESKIGFGGAAATNRTWDNGIVFYTISNEFTESEVNIIKDAMKTIEEKTKLSDKKCIQFKERTNESDYVIIQDGNGCSSMIGRSLSQPQYLNLSRSRSCLLNDYNVKGSLVIHELVHVLGFNHEHTRPDRNKYVTLNYININPNNKKDFDIEQSFFNLNTSYDLESIMHYPSISAACINNEINAIESINEPKKILNNVVLSEIDITEIRMLYNCGFGGKKFIICDPGTIKHTIKRDDTCLKLKLNMEIIAKQNLDCSYLKIGQEICIPKKQDCDEYKCSGGCDCSWVDILLLWMHRKITAVDALIVKARNLRLLNN